jgi:hypothetical protein
MTIKINFTILSVLSLLLLTLIGCEKNVVELSGRKDLTIMGDCCVITLTAAMPLAAIPTVEYTVTNNAEGENEYRLTVLKKADANTPKADRHRAEVSKFDDHRFTVTIPMENPYSKPTRFFLNGDESAFIGYAPVEKELEEE